MTPTYADALTAVVRVVCALILVGGVALLARGICDAHQRGRARVHRGTSWTPRPCLDERDGLSCDCPDRRAA